MKEFGWIIALVVTRNCEFNTFFATSELGPPCLKRDHGACSSIYRFPALPISRIDSQADDSDKLS